MKPQHKQQQVAAPAKVAPTKKSSKAATRERVITLPNSKKTVKRTNTIRFSSKVSVKPITPISKLVKDISTLWYSVDEAKQMKNEAQQLVELMEESAENLVELSEQDPVLLKKLFKSLRGLEKYLNSDDVLETRYNAWDAVLDEQDRQAKKGIFNAESIANAYKLYTIASRRVAFERAAQDALEV